MNDRIQELADQCRTEYRDGHSGFTEQFDEEKFAELILADVIDTIKQSAGSHLMLNANDADINKVQLKVEGALAAMNAISRRFGVE